MHATILHPPKIFVAANFSEAIDRHHFGGVRALFHPGFGHDLFAVPAAMPKIQQAEAGHVAGGDFEVIGAMDREGAPEEKNIARLKIFHAYGFSDALVESVADFFASLLLEDGAHNVVVPVVVVKVCSRRMAASGGAVLPHDFGFKIHRVINAGASAQQVDHTRLLFCLGKRIGSIVDADLFERLVDVDDAFGGVNSVERADEALAHRIGVNFLVDVSPGVDNFPALDNHRGGTLNRIRIGADSGQLFFGPSGFYRSGGVRPRLAGKDFL